MEQNEEKKDVIISIRGLQGFTDTDEDDIELVTEGRYSFRDGVADFEYMESELTGLEGTRTEFTAGPDGVTMTRDGKVSMQLVFREGQKHYCIYDTPYGALTMSIDTRSILSKLGSAGGRLEIKYLIDMENAMISRNSFSINIREAQKQ